MYSGWLALGFVLHVISKIIRLEKHLQCEKLLRLARRTTKKRGNKKSDESIITPIRYNVMNMYFFRL